MSLVDDFLMKYLVFYPIYYIGLLPTLLLVDLLPIYLCIYLYKKKKFSFRSKKVIILFFMASLLSVFLFAMAYIFNAIAYAGSPSKYFLVPYGFREFLSFVDF